MITPGRQRPCQQVTTGPADNSALPCSQNQGLSHQTPLLSQEPEMEPTRCREAGRPVGAEHWEEGLCTQGWGSKQSSGWHVGCLARNTDFPPTRTPVLRSLHASAKSRIHLYPPLHLPDHLPRGLALRNRVGNGSQGQEPRVAGQAGGYKAPRDNTLLQSEC